MSDSTNKDSGSGSDNDTAKAEGTEYVDDFVNRFMQGNALENADAASSEPVVVRTASDAPLEKQILEEQVVLALREVYDPELPVNIYDLGLIYKVDVDDDGNVKVDMTLTTPGCPVAQTFPGTVENAVGKVDGVKSACVELVWEPAWTKDRISEAAKLELGIF